jgi:hypothetical protein
MAQPADAAFLAMEDENIKPPALLRVANILALLGIFVANGVVSHLPTHGPCDAHRRRLSQAALTRDTSLRTGGQEHRHGRAALVQPHQARRLGPLDLARHLHPLDRVRRVAVQPYRSATPRASEIVKRIGWLFVASSACSAGWVIVYVQGTPLSAVVAMLLMWTLVACNVAICWKTAWRPADAHGRELAEVLVVDLCFSIYAGWGEFKAALHLSQPAGRQRCLTGSLVTN